MPTGTKSHKLIFADGTQGWRKEIVKGHTDCQHSRFFKPLNSSYNHNIVLSAPDFRETRNEIATVCLLDFCVRNRTLNIFHFNSSATLMAIAVSESFGYTCVIISKFSFLTMSYMNNLDENLDRDVMDHSKNCALNSDEYGLYGTLCELLWCFIGASTFYWYTIFLILHAFLF